MHSREMTQGVRRSGVEGNIFCGGVRCKVLKERMTKIVKKLLGEKIAANKLKKDEVDTHVRILKTATWNRIKVHSIGLKYTQ